MKANDLLVFPSKDFHKWHSDVKEYIDGLYQIDCTGMEKGKSINITELNLAAGVLNNITEELEHLFDAEKASDFSYHYISTLDEECKRQGSKYSSDMGRCDVQIPVKPDITPYLKYKHLMEIVDDVDREFAHTRKKSKIYKLKRMKKQDNLRDLMD